MEERTCKRCGKVYLDETESPFITCGRCRIYFFGDTSGCHYWGNADDDPRIIRDRIRRMKLSDG